MGNCDNYPSLFMGNCDNYPNLFMGNCDNYQRLFMGNCDDYGRFFLRYSGMVLSASADQVFGLVEGCGFQKVVYVAHNCSCTSCSIAPPDNCCIPASLARG